MVISGGWLLVLNVVIDSSSTPPQLSVVTSLRGISNYHTKRRDVTKSAMNELRSYLNFTQLRFNCRKQEGFTFHITTARNSKGEAVVQYFSGQTDVQPASCGSFVIMNDDNSVLARACKKWGYERGSYLVGKWGHERDQNRLYDHPAFIQGAIWFLSGSSRWECDDESSYGVASGDFWKVFVR